MTQNNPREMTPREYHEHVTSVAEGAIEALEEYPEDFNDSTEQAVEYAIDGSNMIHNRGYRLITLFHTSQHPDNPEYAEEWSNRVNTNDLTAGDALTQMAYACYYSDVMAKTIELLEEKTDE